MLFFIQLIVEIGFDRFENKTRNEMKKLHNNVASAVSCWVYKNERNFVHSVITYGPKTNTKKVMPKQFI